MADRTLTNCDGTGVGGENGHPPDCTNSNNNNNSCGKKVFPSLSSSNNDDDNTMKIGDDRLPSSSYASSLSSLMPSSTFFRYIGGGPQTALPFIIESFFCWVLAISCLGVACWHYIHQLVIPRWIRLVLLLDPTKNDNNYDQHHSLTDTTTDANANATATLLLDVPLMTHSRRELVAISTLGGWLHRYEQLVTWLERYRPLDEWMDPRYKAELVTLIRNYETPRRLVSLIMRRKDLLPSPLLPSPAGPEMATGTTISTRDGTSRNRDETDDDGIRRRRRNGTPGDEESMSQSRSMQQQQQQQLDRSPSLSLAQILLNIWPQLLELPPPNPPRQPNDPDISIILPAFGERGTDVASKLRHAVTCANRPHRLEVLIINAGQCTEWDTLLETVQMMKRPMKSEYDDDDDHDRHDDHDDNVRGNSRNGHDGENGNSTNNRPDLLRPIITVHNFSAGGGRGPCLSFGANHAKGRILTFLHADTLLPEGWDVAVVNAFPIGNNNDDDDNNVINHIGCAFSFAIDTSVKAIERGGGYFPPGIRAIETTANWRTHLFSLPYGDQCLSVPRHVFHYLGGYPDQCLMEDYEFIKLLRQRCAVFPQERLVILPQKAYCSPRRWQRYGVLYVTYTNSKCVNKYSSGVVTPDQLFCHYYGTQSAPHREYEESPWEIQLQKELQDGGGVVDVNDGGVGAGARG